MYKDYKFHYTKCVKISQGKQNFFEMPMSLTFNALILYQVGVKGNPKGVNRGMDCDVIVAEVCIFYHIIFGLYH